MHNNKKGLKLTWLALLALLVARVDAAQWVESSNVPVTMRDGVVLRAEVRRPAGDGRFPVLVYRTPYGKDDALKEYTTFVHALERGYAVVVQDVRGRFASDGEFAPYQNEGHDGYDTIEWAASQPWSNGQVGTFGLSYPGAVQWLAAVEGPPHLKAMVPAMTFSSHRNFFYAAGTFDMSWIDWIWNNIAPDVRVKKRLPGPVTYEEAWAAWKSDASRMQGVLPLSDMNSLRDVAPYYYEWMRHPPDDPWWDWADLPGKYGRTGAAVLNLSGWYDDNYGPEGAITNYAGLLAARDGHAANTALLIGPWVHGVASTGRAKAGERQFSDAARIDYDSVVLDWMDHYVRGLANGVDRRAPVRYYVMGADVWRESQAWPPKATPKSLYLGDAVPGRPGILRAALPHAGSYSSFVADPMHPVTNRYPDSGAHDYSYLATRADLLTFDTEPLARDLEIAGTIESDVFLRCDCQDLDLWVRLYDVAPDGAAWNQMNAGTDVQRASYRDPTRGRTLLRSGEITEIRILSPATATVFKQGHRIRVQVSASFAPNFSRNLQNGELETVSANALKKTIRIYHDAAHPSHVVLPAVN